MAICRVCKEKLKSKEELMKLNRSYYHVPCYRQKQLLDLVDAEEQAIDKTKGKTEFVLQNNMKTSVASEMEIYEREMGEATGENLSSKPVAEEKEEAKEPTTAKEIINEVKLIIESLNPAKKKSLAPKLVEFGINRPSDIAKQTR